MRVGGDGRYAEAGAGVDAVDCGVVDRGGEVGVGVGDVHDEDEARGEVVGCFGTACGQGCCCQGEGGEDGRGVHFDDGQESKGR